MASLGSQHLEAPRYCHPCGDLLDSRRRGDYINICVPLYRASIIGDLEAAKAILQGREYLVRYSITEHKETPLHVAVAVHKPGFVKYLVDMMSVEDLKLQNEEGNNAFCLAAIAGNHKMAMIMLQKNRELLNIRGSGNMMPLYLAAFHKQRHMITYLYDHSQRMASDGWTDDDRNNVFLKCIEINCYGVALQIMDDREELPQDKYVWDVLHVLAGAVDEFPYLPEPTASLIVSPCFLWESKPVIFGNSKATQLLKKIWKKTVVKPKEEIDVILRGPMIKIAETDSYPSQILFVAAENGNTRFLVELIREYPDLVWKTNDVGHTIFHIAVIHRHESIFNLLYVIGTMKDTITQLRDKDGNTMLHLVAMNAGKNAKVDVLGAAFEFERELVWFKEVQVMVPPSYIQLKNAANQTPHEVFAHSHKNLHSESKKWIKQTSSQCMVVATLVTTIAFSAAFTIPGGYDEKNGFPMFLGKFPFMVFVILDGISFIFSSVATLIFLSCSFSSYSHNDFLGVPANFRLGIEALWHSIFTLMAAFSSNFFILYHNKLPIVMTSLAAIAIIYFIYIEFNFFREWRLCGVNLRSFQARCLLDRSWWDFYKRKVYTLHV